ncbi:energy transducer TonB [Mesonia aquimarina]|uniref:energy transducer TonB n=1 Tax=Mesonia aquimarina TaxID=1504967 RepID=UPI001F0967FA|nr:energy transducer TonB [Mesonia aquimarina]
MKNFMFMLFFSALSFSSFAQETKGNTVSSKEVAPVWPGCEEKSEKNNCFNVMLAQHIQQNFHYPKDYSEKDKGTKLIVEFLINKNGEPEIKKISEGRKSLQDAAKKPF